MTKKLSKPKRHTGRSPQASKPKDALPPIPRMAMEQTLTDIRKLLESNNFKSIDEANAYLQQMLAGGGQVPHAEAETPLEQAQELIYQAHETRSARKRGELARQALLICPDCADAYNLLAEEEASLPKKLELLAQAMAAGERALGPELFKELEGNFWVMTETRPYMRACAGVAELSWALGQHTRAIDLYTRMLQLNPGDNQGVRYLLANCLLETGDDAALGTLLKQYPDDGAASWAYSRALSAFRKHNAGSAATKALARAFETNRFVPPLLLGTKPMPRGLPEYIGMGDESEATEYAAFAMRIWRQTPGAIDWLRQVWATKPHPPAPG
jgi:tetratricopeptide (TPR) repeat protein